MLAAAAASGCESSGVPGDCEVPRPSTKVSVVLNVSGVPRGVHYVDYYVAGRGRAWQESRSNNPLAVTAWVGGVVSPPVGSAGGGTLITVRGGGFSLARVFPSAAPVVRVCGAACVGVVVAADAASLTCTTGALATVANAAALGIGAVGAEGVDITAAGYARGKARGYWDWPLEAAFDNDVSTSFVSSTNNDCTLEWHLPAAAAAEVFAVKLHPVPPSQHGNGHALLRGGVIEGSTGEEGAPWVTLVDIPQTLPHGWSTHLVRMTGASSLFRTIRLQSLAGGARCRVAEMRIVGAVRHSVVNGSSVGGDSPECAVDVEVESQGGAVQVKYYVDP